MPQVGHSTPPSRYKGGMTPGSYFGIRGGSGHLQVSRADCCRRGHSVHNWGQQCCAGTRRYHGPRKGGHQSSAIITNRVSQGWTCPFPSDPPAHQSGSSSDLSPAAFAQHLGHFSGLLVCRCVCVCVCALWLKLGFEKLIPCTWTSP